MEEIINFDLNLKHLDVKQLKKIKAYTEKYQVSKICNKIKDENKVIITFDEKIIEMNSEYVFQVKAIRNKYYMQLLNLLNVLSPTKLLDDFAFKEFGEIMYLNNFIQNSDLIKMALINYIGTFYFENIFTLSEKSMLKLDIFNDNNNSRDISDALGMYCHYNEKLFDILEPEITKEELNKIKKCKRFILICPELINKFCKDNYDKLKDYDTDIGQLFEMVFVEVLLHEIGHGVFEYINDRHNEGRADYFAALSSDGTLDKMIKTHKDIVGFTYKLFFIDSDLEEIKKYVYDL